MEPLDYQHQMLQGMRNYMRASFEAMNMLQEQFEKMMNVMLEHLVGADRATQKMTGDWLDSFRKGREDFRRSMEEGLERLEENLRRAQRG